MSNAAGYGAEAKELLADLGAIDALLSDESKWTQGDLGRLCDGTPTRDVDAACRWCLSGAAMKVAGGVFNRRWRGVLEALERHTGRDWYCVPQWNDHDGRTFAEVKQLLAAARTRISAACSAHPGVER